jgi:hypothetical protein
MEAKSNKNYLSTIQVLFLPLHFKRYFFIIVKI